MRWIIRAHHPKNTMMKSHAKKPRHLLVFLLASMLAAGISQAVAQDLPIAELTAETANGTHTFTVEVAGDDATRAMGLMHRTELAPDHGMLFRFSPPRHITMWMKNTPLSLDMVFIGQDGKVHRIAANTVPQSLEYIRSGGEVSDVLEVIAGTAERIGLKPGDQITLK